VKLTAASQFRLSDRIDYNHVRLVSSMTLAAGCTAEHLHENRPDMNEHSLSRREFTSGALTGMLSWSLLDLLVQGEAFSAEVQPEIAGWVRSVNSLAADVKEQRLSQVQWQVKVEELFSRVAPEDLLKLVRFEELTKNLKFVDKGARSLRPKLAEVEGLPENLVFGRQIFALKKNRSVVPHGHNNMATAFLVVKGDLHGRHYDRVEDQKEHVLIRPTIDRIFKPGESSSISDYRDNIHWFKATSQTAFIFNIHVLNVRPGSALPTGRVYVDPNGEKTSGTVIRAPRIGYKQAHELYG